MTIFPDGEKFGHLPFVFPFSSLTHFSLGKQLAVSRRVHSTFQSAITIYIRIDVVHQVLGYSEHYQQIFGPLANQTSLRGARETVRPLFYSVHWDWRCQTVSHSPKWTPNFGARHKTQRAPLCAVTFECIHQCGDHRCTGSYVCHEEACYFLPVVLEALTLCGGYIRQQQGVENSLAVSNPSGICSLTRPTIHFATLPIFTPFTPFAMRFSLQSAVLTALGAVKAVSAFGYMPRDSGIDFADYPYQAPGPNDLRSPCPGLK